MRFYIASHSLERAKGLRDLLIGLGHKVTSRWITQDTKFGHSDSLYTPEERQRLAVMDEEDVRSAVDGVILLAEELGTNVPGGKHVEAGIAIGLGRSVYVVGRRENVFHWHPRVLVFKDCEVLLEYLTELKEGQEGLGL